VNLSAEIETADFNSPLPKIFTNSFLEDKPFSTNTSLVTSVMFLASTNAWIVSRLIPLYSFLLMF
jgi:hypothetical protein